MMRSIDVVVVVVVVWIRRLSVFRLGLLLLLSPPTTSFPVASSRPGRIVAASPNRNCSGRTTSNCQSHEQHDVVTVRRMSQEPTTNTEEVLLPADAESDVSNNKKKTNKLVTAAAVSAEARALFYETPLLYSAPLSKRITSNNGTTTNEIDVYVKLDCLQPSGSFKDRGMAHLLTTLVRNGFRQMVSSSGGNAGLAAATVAQQLGVACTVVVPTTTKPFVIDKLRNDLQATVIVHGAVWNEADAHARQLVAADPTSIAYVPPYDNELLWTGHSTVVDEIYQHGLDPDAIIVSVGGGGLLCGVLEGLQRHRHQHNNNNSNNHGGGDDDAATTSGEETFNGGCRVIAAETVGASSFAQAFRGKRLVRLPAITSIATSLGALQVSPSALSRAINYHPGVSTAVCTDAQAIDACVQVRTATTMTMTTRNTDPSPHGNAVDMLTHFFTCLVCPGPSDLGRTGVRRRFGRYLFATVRLFVLVNTNDRTTGRTTTTTRGGGGNLWGQWRQPGLVARLAKGILVVKLK
jgi:L-serine/L-threonine ammonia-lyase